jgi:two-component system response regulator HydG
VEHVLLVEDEPILRRMFCTFLRAEGYIVEDAKTLDEAKRILDTELIDLVVSDLKLGLESAEDLYQWVVERYPAMKERFIVISGWPEVEGFPYFLEKPFHIDTLIETIKLAMKGSSIVGLAPMGEIREKEM